MTASLTRPLTEKAAKARIVRPDTMCDFGPEPTQSSSAALDSYPPPEAVEELHGMDEDDHVLMTASAEDVLPFGPWVNQVRIQTSS